jgi:iron complex outermembrane receptor protein
MSRAIQRKIRHPLRVRAGLLGGVALLVLGAALDANAQPQQAPAEQSPATQPAPSTETQPSAPQAPGGQAPAATPQTPEEEKAGARLPTVQVEARRLRPSRAAARTAARAPRVVAAPAGQPTTASPPALPTQQSGQAAWGPVRGYVASNSATATKTNTPLIETPQAVSVVTRDQIEAQAAQNLSQALRYTSGVVTEQTGVDLRFQQVYVRGFVADQYLDTLKLLPGSFAVPQIEIYNLQRIEVLHGPSSVLYGQGSPGGIVNMISKRPTAEPFHEFVTQAGSYGLLMGGIDSSGPIDQEGHFLYRLTAMARETGTQVDFTEYQRGSISPSFTWRPTADTTFTFLANYQHDPKSGFFNQLPARGTALFNPFGQISTHFYSGEPSFDKFDREQYNTGYVFEHRFSDAWTVRQNLRYMHVTADFATVFPTGGLLADLQTVNRNAFTTLEELKTFAVDTQSEAKFATGPFVHTLLLGNDYQRAFDSAVNRNGLAPRINVFNPSYGLSIPPPPVILNRKQVQDQLGFYAQDQIKLGGWNALIGARDDRADLETNNLLTKTLASQVDKATTRRAALLYLFDIGLAPYVQYTQSFQPTIGTDFAGKPFKPTTGQQKEVGVKYQPPGSNFLTSVAVFDLVQQNVLTPDPAHVLFSVQTGQIRSRGVEFESKASVTDNFNMTAAYSFLNQVVEQANDGSVGKRPVGIPTHTASLWGDYTIPWGPFAGFGLAAGARYLGPSAGDTLNTFFIPGATLMDAAIHYDFANLSPALKGYYLAVNAQNVFDKVYVQWCQNQGCWYGARRTVIGTLRYRW